MSRRALPLAALALLAACSSAYYATLESFGVEKRDILVDRIEEGRDAQQDAKQEFLSALQAFKATTGFDGGGLEDVYDRLKDRLDACEARARGVRGRIEAIEDLAGDLFAEWKAEAAQYASPDLRAQSEALLADTRQRYGTLLAAMKKAERKMDPVLATLAGAGGSLGAESAARSTARPTSSSTTCTSTPAIPRAAPAPGRRRHRGPG